MPGPHVIVHGHFYQPPRENPWTDRVERQPSAAPHHDWNARILAECYRANAFARLHGDGGRIVRIVNNYARMSFNFGPTLMGWIQRHDPTTYRRIVEGDRESRRRLGAGNAIAQPYSHMILPLSNARDRRTQIRWGIADFRRRFGRRPEGMWLPETAVDHATLEAMAAEGIRFTVLAPSQAHRVRPIGGGPWTEGLPDAGRPYTYRCRDGSGRHLAIFFYDPALSHEAGFGTLLKDGRHFAERLRTAHESLVTVATDGETYGHHRTFADLSLAFALTQPELTPVNFAHALAARPPEMEVEIRNRSSWSCPHGVERWNSDCGCRLGTDPRWTQGWRRPLRAALDVLRERLAARFETAGARVLRDPWAARDDYIQVLLNPGAAGRFFKRHGRGSRIRARELLEMQRQAMLMYTSCGWFFDDVSGIETIQILRHAARAIELSGQPRLGRLFARDLARAKSNRPEYGDGGQILKEHVMPFRMSPERAVAHVLLGSRRAAPAYTVRLNGARATCVSTLTGTSQSFRVSTGDDTCTVNRKRFSLADLLPEDREAILTERARQLVERARPLATELTRIGRSLVVTFDDDGPSNRKLIHALRAFIRRPDADRLAALRRLLADERPDDLREAQDLYYGWAKRIKNPSLIPQAVSLGWELGFTREAFLRPGR